MTLATHIIIAAAASKPLAGYSPVFSFLAAFLSHYLADAIPHWDYDLKSAEDEENPAKIHWVFNRSHFKTDLLHTALDGFLGAGLAILFLNPHSAATWLHALAVIIGGALPDFLEGIYYTKKAEFLEPVHRFHNRMHTKVKLGPYPSVGIPLQLLILIIASIIIL